MTAECSKHSLFNKTRHKKLSPVFEKDLLIIAWLLNIVFQGFYLFQYFVFQNVCPVERFLDAGKRRDQTTINIWSLARDSKILVAKHLTRTG